VRPFGQPTAAFAGSGTYSGHDHSRPIRWGFELTRPNWCSLNSSTRAVASRSSFVRILPSSTRARHRIDAAATWEQLQVLSWPFLETKERPPVTRTWIPRVYHDLQFKEGRRDSTTIARPPAQSVAASIWCDSNLDYMPLPNLVMPGPCITQLLSRYHILTFQVSPRQTSVQLDC
jgi:hypothetical protein